jgi:hypothetical protein
MILLTIAEWLAWGIVAALVFFGLAVVMLLIGYFVKEKQ